MHGACIGMHRVCMLGSEARAPSPRAPSGAQPRALDLPRWVWGSSTPDRSRVECPSSRGAERLPPKILRRSCLVSVAPVVLGEVVPGREADEEDSQGDDHQTDAHLTTVRRTTLFSPVPPWVRCSLSQALAYRSLELASLGGSEKTALRRFR